MVTQETIEIQKELFKEGGKLGKYQDLILGERGLLKLVKYELVIGLTSWIPGALGLFLRSKLYPKIIGRVGRNVTFGTSVVLRHPKKIFIGDNVVIDDNCVLDAKGTDNRGIFIGDGVFIGRNTSLFCKNGDIILEDFVNISFNCMIFSASEVRVGAEELMAAYCYLVGGTHHFNDPLVPVLRQGRSSTGIQIGPGGWLGAHVTVFDGVKIGKHAVIGAGSAVNRIVPDFAVAAGVPISIIKERDVVEIQEPKKKITIGLINYNNGHVLEETMESVLAQDYPVIEEILFVDNCSTDSSINLIQKKYPNVKIFKTQENLGPNPARNLALREAKTDWALLMDSDVVLSPDTLSKLSESLEQNENAGVAAGQIRFYEERDKIQYNGCHIHFAGGAIANPFDLEKALEVEAVPGGAMLVDRNKAKKAGMFDEDFIFGWEDGDFSFRMTIAGYPCLSVSRARVYHRKEKKGIRWIKYQVRNRWWFILKNYNWRTIIVILPAVLFYQLAIGSFFILKGQGKAFVQGSLAVFSSLPSILRKRKEVMKFKKVKDRQVLSAKGMDLIGEAGDSSLVRFVTQGFNLMFSVYWMFARWLIK